MGSLSLPPSFQYGEAICELCGEKFDNWKVVFMKKWLISLVLVAVAGLVSAEEASTNAVERFVRYQFTLTNQKGSAISNAEFWARAPVKQSPYQRCVSLETSVPYELITDEQGNQTLYFSFKDFPPYVRKIITVKSTLELSPVPAAVAVDPAKYLGAAPLMELDSPEFKALAPKFGAGKAVAIAKMAMSWVRQNVQDAGYQKGVKKGSADEF